MFSVLLYLVWNQKASLIKDLDFNYVLLIFLVNMLREFKNTVPWTYVINEINSEKIIGTFYEKELEKANPKKIRIEKIIKKKGDKLYVKWKGYDSSFNSWIDKKDLVK